jgi:hypothetical protein
LSSKNLASITRGLQRSRLVGANLGNREKDDFYATPAESTWALLRVEQFSRDVWEPACGDGAISKVLTENGYNVVSSDLVNRGYGESGIDFLMEWQSRATNVVTNPPFKLSTKFVQKALQLTTGKVAMLLKVGFLEGIERAPVFDKSPFARLWIFRRRQSFLRGGVEHVSMNGAGGMIAYGWFVWEHGYTGKPTLGWI